MTRLEQLKKQLRPGQVFRRQDMADRSNAVDRHLRQLVAEGTLVKLAGGLYEYPKMTVFGQAPAEDDKVVKAFLKGDEYLVTSPNAYNGLGVGTTQLYNKTVVYNHKRHGEFVLGGRTFDFRVKPSFPKALSTEFLLVDLVSNVDLLAESRDEVLSRVKERAASADRTRLQRAAERYGSVRAKKFFREMLKADMTPHVR
jgi:Family of unknown function (DUF6088)